ncbi:MAG TPA: DUF4136 domain-containing protein [Thermoanaerobaculia bacterium]|nr:DUF4136 domain-containing protein [Thermoanaerobaculia bacterium]
MRSRLGFILVTAAIATLAACSSITTSADYDKAANFSQYKTYAWKDTDQKQNELVENRIKAAVDAQLQAKGLHKVDSSPDLWVVEHVRLSEQTQINTYDSGWGYGWGWRGYGGGGMSSTTVQKIPVGNLIVDLVDAKENQLKWRGTASKTLDPSASVDKKTQNVNEAVAKMFESYPPK